MNRISKIFFIIFISIAIFSFAYSTYPKWLPVNIEFKKKQIPKKWRMIQNGMSRNKIIQILGYPNGMDMWRIKADEWVVRDNLGWYTLGVVYNENSQISGDIYIHYKLGNHEVYSKPYILK